MFSGALNNGFQPTFLDRQLMKLFAYATFIGLISLTGACHSGLAIAQDRPMTQSFNQSFNDTHFTIESCQISLDRTGICTFRVVS
jgi:hypothetical protein